MILSFFFIFMYHIDYLFFLSIIIKYFLTIHLLLLHLI
jgi:hypothetical protein